MVKSVCASTRKPSSERDRLDCPLTTPRHLTLRRKSRTPSPSDMLMSWARPLLASIAIALRSSDSGIPDNTDDTGGFAISYNVKIVFSCPVDVACKYNRPPARRVGMWP